MSRKSVSIQAVTTEASKPQYSEHDIERFRHLRDLIEAEADHHDKAWVEYTDFDDYSDYLDDDETIVSNFIDNYSSGKIGFQDFDDLSAEDIAKAVPKDILIKKIREHSALEACDDTYIQWNEMGSIGIGEYEHQIDIDESLPGLAAALANMTDADIQRFNQWCYARVSRGSFCVYGRPCERLVLKLDPEAFLADDIIRASLSLTCKT